MNEPCSNTAAEIAHNSVSPIEERRHMKERFEKRTEVMTSVQKLLAGKPVRIRKGDHTLSYDDVLELVIGHNLFSAAMHRACENDPSPIRDLTIRCAQWQVCEYLFEGESEELGFIL